MTIKVLKSSNRKFWEELNAGMTNPVFVCWLVCGNLTKTSICIVNIHSVIYLIQYSQENEWCMLKKKKMNDDEQDLGHLRSTMNLFVS